MEKTKKRKDQVRENTAVLRLSNMALLFTLKVRSNRKTPHNPKGSFLLASPYIDPSIPAP